MRVLDRYIFFTFLRVFVGTLVVFSVAVVALDYFSRLNQFLDPNKVEGTFAEGYGGAKIVILFYLSYLPFVLKEVLPFVTVAAGLFTLTTMLRQNEVFPVVAAGVSVRRLFLPLFVAGALVSAGYMAFQEYVVPALGREQIALKRFFSGDRKTGMHNMPHLRDGKGTVTRIKYFSYSDRSLENVVVQRPWTGAGFDLWTAKRLEPDGDAWTAVEGVHVQPAGVDSLPRDLPPGTRVDFGVTPEEVDALASKKGTNELSYSQLYRLARKFPNRRHLTVALHKQVARPFVTFVLLLVGIPTLIGAGRSYFLGGSVAFGVSLAYYCMDIFFTSLGNRGDLPAVFAAYFPIALLLSLGIARVATVRT